jgi:hypothetical protein
MKTAQFVQTKPLTAEAKLKEKRTSRNKSNMTGQEFFYLKLTSSF